jgi:glycosyltransferase involved in cell wall biosynthesis
MLTVAYLANRFPAAVEPYVGEEIQELRRRGVKVIPGSVRKPDKGPHGLASTDPDSVDPDSVDPDSVDPDSEILCLQPLRILILLRALGLAMWHWKRIVPLMKRVLLSGKESPRRRIKALLHTWLGAYYAVLLQKRRVDHIRVHHGYFGAWIVMVAARLLGIDFSLTLHGSDLLVDGAHLDTKLQHCQFCTTVSDYNRRYILERFPGIDPKKIIVSRLGVDDVVSAESEVRICKNEHRRYLTLLAVGRLHAVKDHAFLIRACARLRDSGLDFQCLIAGEGPERRRLESLIRQNQLEEKITLRGHVGRAELDALYERADAVVLTSRSEGIPLVLMEAMIRSRLVLAPAVTGIPEIVIPGKTGFLYTPGALEDFVARIFFLDLLMRSEDRFAVSRLDWIRHAARSQVLQNFNRRKNLAHFGERFLQLIADSHFASHNLASRDSAPENSATQEFRNSELRNRGLEPAA